MFLFLSIYVIEGKFFMNYFATGVIAGSLVAAVSVGLLMSDSRTRRRIARGRRHAIRKTEDLIDGVTDMF